ncbi:unnamed protein product [Musa acuminata subsp. malaccensis]|uniref:(wild Malaysian banana) hypothetical protein n=1 Tax=Musa acuminata subsp. malaccensis TaxID=214687 RepID=A0A804HQH7_MUSAM|nr:unnamed protein product [Musa acuminata subsp. malaccensis]
MIESHDQMGSPCDYLEYINVIAKGDTRYIMDINLVAEFEIVKSTTDYVMLLRVVPTIGVHQRHEHVHAVVKAKGVALKATRAQRSHVGDRKLCTVDIGCREMPVSKKKLAMTHRSCEIIF